MVNCLSAREVAAAELWSLRPIQKIAVSWIVSLFGDQRETRKERSVSEGVDARAGSQSSSPSVMYWKQWPHSLREARTAAWIGLLLSITPELAAAHKNSNGRAISRTLYWMFKRFFSLAWALAASYVRIRLRRRFIWRPLQIELLNVKLRFKTSSQGL